MKQLISVLVAAMFAAVSVAAIAQDKAGDKGTKTKTSQTKAKGDDKKTDGKKAKTSAKKTTKKSDDKK